jgi:hypothetical protein
VNLRGFEDTDLKHLLLRELKKGETFASLLDIHGGGNPVGQVYTGFHFIQVWFRQVYTGFHFIQVWFRQVYTGFHFIQVWFRQVNTG